MSGAEAAGLVFGLISGIITVIDATKKVYDAAKDKQGLPAAFREVGQRLPLVESILNKAEEHAKQGLDSKAAKAAEPTLTSCKQRLEKLREIFEAAVPQENASRYDHYYKAVRALGKDSKVAALMKGILTDLNLLSGLWGMETGDAIRKLKEATAASSISEPLVLGHAFDDAHSGGSMRINSAGNGNPLQAGASDMFMGARATPNLGSKKSVEAAAAACRDALRATNPYIDREQLKTEKGKRVSTTCEWIRHDSVYKSWLNGNTPLLWISGGPGKGKTMLSIFLTEELECHSKEMGRATVLYFFCSNQDETRNTAATILRGFLYQVVEKHPHLMESHILPFFETEQGSQLTLSSLETLWAIFQKLLQDSSLGTTFCVVDGLDECDDDSQRAIIRKFVDFSTQKHGGSFKAAILSRELVGLEQCAQVKLDADNDENVASDVKQFISHGVKDLSRIPGFEGAFRTHVEKTLLERADGTFLWAGFVMNELAQTKTFYDIKRALDAIPRGLPAIYSRILLQIEEFRRPIIRQILRRVTIAIRPLTIQELAVVIDIQASGHLSVDQVIRDHITSCNFILKVHQDQVSLIHQSAKDYLIREEVDQNQDLETFRIQPEEAHLALAQKCLDCISATSCPESFPLSNYAVLYWPEHAKNSATLAGKLLNLSLPFFKKKSSVREKWYEAYVEARRPGGTYTAFSQLPFGLLHLASHFGITAWVEIILRQNKSLFRSRILINNKDSRAGTTPLFCAAKNGHETIVKLLLETNAIDVNMADYSRMSPLYAAAENGHETIAKLLLETNGISVNMTDYFGTSPLSCAAKNGHEVIVKLLLEINEIDVNITDHYGMSPLSSAAKNGHETIVKLLLEADGMDINMVGHSGMSPLYAAAGNGHEAIVKLLLENGMDINMAGHSKMSPLSAAAGNGHDTIVKLLLKVDGIDINMANSSGKSPLFLAIKNGHETIINLLLEADGINPNVTGHLLKDTLATATKDGMRNITSFFLRKDGIRTDMIEEFGVSPLSLAVSEGYEPIVKSLLETGKVDVSHRKELVALALKRGYGDIAEMLLGVNKKADHQRKPCPRWTDTRRPKHDKWLFFLSFIELPAFNKKTNSQKKARLKIFSLLE